MREGMNPSPGWGGFALNPTKPCSCGQLSCSCRSWKLQKLLPAGISAVARDTGWGRWAELLDAGKTSHGQEEKRRRCLSTRSALLCSLIFGWDPQPRDGSSKIPSPQGQPAGTLPWPSCSHPMAEAFPTPAAGNNSGQCKQKQDTAPLTTALT